MVQVGSLSIRTADGGFLPPVPLYVSEDCVSESQREAVQRALAEMMAAIYQRGKAAEELPA